MHSSIMAKVNVYLSNFLIMKLKIYVNLIEVSSTSKILSLFFFNYWADHDEVFLPQISMCLNKQEKLE